MIKKIGVVAVMMSLLTAFPVQAAIYEPQRPEDHGKSVAELNGCDEATWNALNDSTLEYAELENLVKLFNPTLQPGKEAYHDAVSEMEVTVNDLRDTEKLLKESYENETNPMIKQVYSQYYREAKAGREQAAKVYDYMNREVNSYNYSLRLGQTQLIAGVRALMLGYRNIVANREMVAKLVELRQLTCDATAALVGQGMATATDLQSAQAELLSARSTLLSLDATAGKLYDQLITMCGWQPGSAVTIGEIPVPDQAILDAMDPVRDAETAIGNNYTLYTYRRTQHSTTEQGLYRYNLTEDQMENAIRIRMQSYYADVQSRRKAYEAALAGFQGAQITQKSTERQYELGLLSNAQYAGLNVAFLQKKAAYQAALYDLVSACNTYWGAMDGNCPVQ